MIRAAVQQPLKSTQGFRVSSLGKELEGNLLLQKNHWNYSSFQFELEQNLQLKQH